MMGPLDNKPINSSQSENSWVFSEKKAGGLGKIVLGRQGSEKNVSWLTPKKRTGGEPTKLVLGQHEKVSQSGSAEKKPQPSEELEELEMVDQIGTDAIRGNAEKNSPSDFHRINAGKAKVISVKVLERSKDGEILKTDGLAYYTPTRSSKIKEMRGEMIVGDQIAAALNTRCTSAEADEYKKYIDLDKKELTGDEQIKGQYTQQGPLARGDLGNYMKEAGNDLSITEKMKMCYQIFTGGAGFHKAGYLHRDVKPDNFLVFPDNTVKLADLGKTEQIPESGILMHVGNPRFSAPEGHDTVKSESYSFGLVAISVLEKSVLKRSNDMVLVNENVDLDYKTKTGGIERFLVSNKLCPQKDNNSSKMENISSLSRMTLKYLAAQLKQDGGEVVQEKKPLESAPNQVHLYIDALFVELEKDADETTRPQLATMKKVLKGLTEEHPADRPTLDEARAALSFLKIENEAPQ